MEFQAYCYACERKVTAALKRRGDKSWTLQELKRALRGDEDVRVGHPASPGDHEWKLNRQEKDNLLGFIESGVVKW
jgi:hypothetical protein